MIQLPQFFNYIYFNAKKKVSYWIYPFDPGIQVWLVDVNEALVTEISGASYPNDHLYHTNFLFCRHGWKFHGLAGSVDLLQLSLFCFNQCDTASVIIAAASSSSYDVFWVTTLVFLGYIISPLKTKQSQNSLSPHHPIHPHPVLRTNRQKMRISCTARLFLLLSLTTRNSVGCFFVGGGRGISPSPIF